MNDYFDFVMSVPWTSKPDMTWGEEENPRKYIKIVTKDKLYFPVLSYRRDGKLRKNATKTQLNVISVDVERNIFVSEFVEAIVFQHNAFINRDKPEELKKLVSEIIEDKTEIIFNNLFIKEDKENEEDE